MKKFRCLFLLIAVIIFSVRSYAQSDLTVYRRTEGTQYFMTELLIKDPTKAKIEGAIDSLVGQQSKIKKFQIDIFDDKEALERRADQAYPTALVYRHWLVSITDKDVYRFYIKERPDIK